MNSIVSHGMTLAEVYTTYQMIYGYRKLNISTNCAINYIVLLNNYLPANQIRILYTITASVRPQVAASTYNKSVI